MHWRGYVVPSDHNYAGIGAYTGSDRYMCKPTPRRGIRAQIQHLRNYADPASVSTNLGAPFESRPKYDANAFNTFVYKGAAPRWIDLNGKWAVPGSDYGHRILKICGEVIGQSTLSLSTRIMGANQITAAQLAARVRAVGNPWKPEISPESMAAIYIDEGRMAGVRGDVAFCQSILETGWFSWPSSPASASTEATAGGDQSEPSITTEGDESTTTTVPGEPTTTTTTVPVTDPVLDGYFELQHARTRN